MNKQRRLGTHRLIGPVVCLALIFCALLSCTNDEVKNPNLETTPDPKGSLSLVETAENLQSQRKFTQALQLWEQVLKANPNDGESTVTAAECAICAGQNQRAIELLDRAGKLATSNNDEYLQALIDEARARYLMETNDPDLQKIEAMLKTSTETVGRYQRDYFCPYQALGQLYSKMGKLGDAADSFRTRADLEPGNPTAQLEAADALEKTGDRKMALNYLDRAIRLSPSSKLKARRTWLSLRLRMAGSEEVETKSPVELADLVAAFGRGEYDQVRTNAASGLFAQDAGPRRVLLGFVALLEKEYGAASALFKHARTEPGVGLGPQVGLGHVALTQKRYEEAGSYLAPVFESNSDGSAYSRLVHRMACLGMGWLLANQDRHEESIVYFDKILFENPNHLFALLGKGNAMNRLGKFDEAENLFSQVLQNDPTNPYAHAELAAVMLNKGDDATAEALFQRAAELGDRRYTCPHEGLGLIYLRQGKSNEAKAEFAKAIQANPDIEYKKYNGLAKIYIREGKIAEAEKLLKKSIENYPLDPEAKELLAKLRNGSQ
jgi:tetratricopeptide (TPR) repeat protein